MKAIFERTIDTADFARKDYSISEKKDLLKYMHSFDVFCVGGVVYDFAKDADTSIENVCYSDGEFVWQEEEIYHIEKYNAAVTSEFMNRVLN